MYRNKPSGVKLRLTDPYVKKNHNVRALVLAATPDTSPPQRQSIAALEEFGVLRMWYHEDQPALTLQVHAKDVEHFNKILEKLSESMVIVDVRVIVSQPIERDGWIFEDSIFADPDDSAESDVAKAWRDLYGA